MEQKRPYVLARFDWSSGALVLRMAMRGPYGGLLKIDTPFADAAYRWRSRQAARKFLIGLPKHQQTWEVLDLRRVRASGRNL